MKAKYLAVGAALLGASLIGTARGDAIEDAWVMGKLEATYALNTHLSAFAIDTDVKDGVVTLSGTVETDIDRDLATEIAKGIEGVTAVNNERLTSAQDPQGARDTSETGKERREFAAWVGEATTTAAVKSKLIRNDNIRARDINVDTKGDVVTLRGQVASNEERQLAEQLARNTDDVDEVRNELSVVQR